MSGKTGLFEFSYFAERLCGKYYVLLNCFTQKSSHCRVDSKSNRMNGFIELNWILHGFNKTILSFHCDVVQNTHTDTFVVVVGAVVEKLNYATHRVLAVVGQWVNNNHNNNNKTASYRNPSIKFTIFNQFECFFSLVFVCTQYPKCEKEENFAPGKVKDYR